jgi:hypothetical protein
MRTIVNLADRAARCRDADHAGGKSPCKANCDALRCDTSARRANHLPDEKPVQPSREKFSAFIARQISRLYAASRSTGGAARDRHDTRDGTRWTRGVVARLMRVDERRRSPAKPSGKAGWSRTAKSRGPDASRLALRFMESIREATVTTKPDHRGERDINRKATAQGRPDCFRFTCMLVCALHAFSCARDRGCSAHPVFPAPSSWWVALPLFFWGGAHFENPGETRRGNASDWLFDR